MGKKSVKNLLTGSIPKHLFDLVLPSIGGMFAITIFNLTDTYFVSKLGTNELDAMGFTFPVIMVIGSITGGIGIGSSSVVARALGKNNHHEINRTTTDGIILSIIVVVIISLIGLLTIDPLFSLLGADNTILPLVKDYMSIWYLGVVAVIMPRVCDSSMRALGDMKRPLIVMLVCALTNLILDPIFIFGYFGIPALGIKGAAIATILSRILGMVTTLSFVHFHYKLIDFKYNYKSEIFDSWKKILHVGIPGAIIRLFPQLLRAVLTSLGAKSAGIAGVAAIAAGARIESFSTIISMAVGAALVPIVGQNWGAKKYERVEEVKKLTNKISIVYGFILFVLSLIFTRKIATIFTGDPVVIDLIYAYVNIVMLGSIGLNLYNWTSESLNATGKPKYVLIINGLGTCLIIIPSIYIGFFLGGFPGMLIGISIGQIILGGVSVKIGKKELGMQAV
ncbi:MATE family efflux transporter [Ilyobacter polytropus]|uniref:Multidrug-efflux transporter n=1 Tax=Ilyobacter polytropus (strain ATCC 51220 / DSM 2926 / LMG 16218 / CuHBu1) TaxID=572544 RepID=E3HBU5_ILYPC|nr:MATE family efflux transporter [Ilyobacter polytropus]ADO83857.1 MATE efflux family protein [Ilyobacter polytropus DSM 2926]